MDTERETQFHVKGEYGELLENFLAIKASWFIGQLTYQTKEQLMTHLVNRRPTWAERCGEDKLQRGCAV